MSELSHQGAFRLIYKRRRTEAEQGTLQSHLQHCPECRQDAEMAGLFTDHLVLKELPARPSPRFSVVYREQAARRSRRSQIMKPIYSVGGAVALALLMLAGWFIIRSNIQTTGLVEAPQLPAISASEPQAALDNQLIEAVKGKDVAAVEQLLDEGAGADAVDAEGHPALYYAVLGMETGSSADMVAMLLNNGANPDVVDGRGTALLSLTAKNGRLEVVQLLLDAGADVNAKFAIGSDNDKSPLIEAVRYGHVEIVELLISHGADVEQEESIDHSRPLHYAASNDNPEIIRILLDEGADLSAGNVWQWTPLFNAVRYSSAETAQLLVNAGAEVNALSVAGRTPMIMLIEQGRLGGMTDKMMLLLDNGADPNVPDNNGDTALHFAASMGKLEAIPILIEHGVDVNVQNNEGQTSLDIAANDQIAEMLREAGAVEGSQAETAVGSLDEQLIEAVAIEDAALLEQLLDTGANPNALDEEGNALLAIAAQNGEIEIVQLLLDAGADINGTLTNNSAEEGTALLWAAVRDHIEVVRLLIANGADLDKAETLYDRTALHGAAWYNNVEVVKILIEGGADPNQHSSFEKGKAPLHFGVENASQEAVQALLDGGADADIQTTGGVTPMMMAQDSGMLTTLLDGGANPNMQDNMGNTALNRAALANNDDFVSILIEHEADVGIENFEGQTALDLATDDKVIETLRQAGAEGGS